MIGKDILKRIEALEKASKRKNTPFLIIAIFDEIRKKWRIQESYSDPFRQNELKWFASLDEYREPEGFNGVFIVDDVQE